MRTPPTTRIEMPWELEGRAMLIVGDVTIGKRFQHVGAFRCIDLAKDDDLDLSSADRDVAEEVLIEEAQRIWRTP